MVRILHILHSMNRGGTEAMLMNLYRHIDRNQVQFDFLLTEQNHCQYENEILAMGGRVYRAPRLSLKHLFLYIACVYKFFKEHSTYKIVHSHTSSKSAIPLAIAKVAGIPIRIAHSHNNSSGKWSLNRIVRDGLKPFLKIVMTNGFACSVDAKRWLFGNKCDMVDVFPNAIDLSAFSRNEEFCCRIKKQLNINENLCVIGMVARFSEQKNHLFAIEVFAEFVKKNSSAILLLVGDGELRLQIEEKIKLLHLENNVIMTGVVPNVQDYLQIVKVLLMPSLYEGLGIALIEAQAVGIPCLASTGVPKEANITGLVEFLSLEESPKAWASKIEKMLANPRNVDCHKKLADAGYDITESAKKLQNWYISKYESLQKSSK